MSVESLGSESEVEDIIDVDDDESLDDEDFEDEVEALLAKQMSDLSRPSSARPESARPGSARPESSAALRPSSAMRPESALKRSNSSRSTLSSSVSIHDREVYDPLGSKKSPVKEEETEEVLEDNSYESDADFVVSESSAEIKTARTDAPTPAKPEHAKLDPSTQSREYSEEEYEQESFVDEIDEVVVEEDEKPALPEIKKPHPTKPTLAAPTPSGSSPRARPKSANPNRQEVSTKQGLRSHRLEPQQTPTRPKTSNVSAVAESPEDPKKNVRIVKSARGMPKVPIKSDRKSNSMASKAPRSSKPKGLFRLSAVKGVQKVYRDNERLQEQNRKLKEEVRALRSSCGLNGLPWSPRIESEEMTDKRWSADAPVKLRSIVKLRMQQCRPASAGILYHGIMSKEEQELWDKLQLKPMSQTSFMKQQLAIKEALWDSSVAVSKQESGPSTLLALLSNKQKSKKTSKTGKKEKRKVSMKKVKEVQIAGQVTKNTAQSILRVYMNSMGHTQPEKRTSLSKVNSVRRKIGTNKKTTKIRPESSPSDTRSPRMHTHRLKQAMDFDEQIGDMEIPPEVLPDVQPEPEQYDDDDVPFDWCSTDLFLNSAEKLRNAAMDKSQMELLLSAIDSPKHLESSFYRACDLLETIWDELYVDMDNREQFRARCWQPVSSTNYTYILSHLTRLISLRNKLLHTFQLIKRRERLVDSLADILNPDGCDEDHPQSPSRMNSAADEMSEIRNLNEGLSSMIQDITDETRQPFILHGIPYLQKMRIDLVLH